MIIIRSSHAARRRDRAAARLLDEQTRLLREERRERSAERAVNSSLPWWRQPTIGDVIAARQARKREQPHDPQSRPGR